MNEQTELIISLTLVIVASFFAGFLLRPIVTDYFQTGNVVRTNILEGGQCQNLSLEKSAYCLRDYVNDFYKYVPRNETFSSLKDLKENGGDCSDYSKLYRSMAEQLDLKATIVNIFPDKGEGHSFAIIYDRNLTGYCKTEIGLNKSEVECVELE